MSGSKILLTVTWKFFYKIFEGELLVVFKVTFTIQQISKICFCLRDFIKIIRLVLAAGG